MLHTVHCYYCDMPNAGDRFNVDLLAHYGYGVDAATPDTAEIVCVGSVMGFLPPNFSGALMGAGFISEDCYNSLSDAMVYAVRGHLSVARVGRRPMCTVGDPGLLAPKLYSVAKPTVALGLVPHYVDSQSPSVRALEVANPHDVRIIDITGEPQDVIRQMSQCAAIASSSLHGLVFADAFRIPSVWMELSDRVIGGRFKFLDYYSVFYDRPPGPLLPNDLASLSRIIGSTALVPDCTLQSLQEKLHVLYSSLVDVIEEVRSRRRTRARQYALRASNYLRRKAFRPKSVRPAMSSVVESLKLGQP